MWTVPAHSFCAPTRAKLIAAARSIPGDCAVLLSRLFPGITRTPFSFQSVISTPSRCASDRDGSGGTGQGHPHAFNSRSFGIGPRRRQTGASRTRPGHRAHRLGDRVARPGMLHSAEFHSPAALGRRARHRGGAALRAYAALGRPEARGRAAPARLHGRDHADLPDSPGADRLPARPRIRCRHPLAAGRAQQRPSAARLARSRAGDARSDRLLVAGEPRRSRRRPRPGRPGRPVEPDADGPPARRLPAAPLGRFRLHRGHAVFPVPRRAQPRPEDHVRRPPPVRGRRASRSPSR